MSIHGVTRWRNVALGGASALAARVIAMGCGFAQVPLSLQYLGTEAFGIWVTLQAFAGLTVMLDLGTGYHLQNAASAANVTGDLSALDGPLRSSLWTALSVAAGLALLAAFFGGGRWPALLTPGEPALRAELGRWMGALIALVACGIPAGIGQRLAVGVQQSWLVAASQAAASFFTLLVVIVCTTHQVSVTVFLACTLTVPIVVNAALLIWMLRRLGIGRTLWRPPARSVWLSGLRGGSLFFVSQLSAALRQSAPPVIVAATLGLSAVTPFNLVQRLMNLLVQPQLWVMEPLWAAYADAKSRGEYAWIRRTLNLSFMASIAMVVLPIGFSYWWAPRFLEWWTRHPAADFPAGLLGWMATWYALTVLVQPISYFLNSQGEMQWQALYGSVATLLGLAAMIPACLHGGLGLACLPFALVLAFINLPCAIADMRRVLRQWNPPRRLAPG